MGDNCEDNEKDNKDSQRPTVPAHFKKCIANGSSSYDKQAYERFNKTMNVNVQKYLSPMLSQFKPPLHPYQKLCLAHSMKNSRETLWNSGIFRENDYDADTDAITGALMMCLPRLVHYRSNLEEFIKKYIIATDDALQDITKLYPELRFPRLETQQSPAMVKMAVLGA